MDVWLRKRLVRQDGLIMSLGGGDGECGDGKTEMFGEMMFEIPDSVEIEDGEFAEEEMIDANFAGFEVGGMRFPRAEVLGMGEVDLVEYGENVSALDASPFRACLPETDTVLDEMGAGQCVPKQAGCLPAFRLGTPMAAGNHDGTGPPSVFD